MLIEEIGLVLMLDKAFMANPMRIPLITSRIIMCTNVPTAIIA